MSKAKYDALGIEPSASAEDVRRAYRRLALEHHPDKGGDPERMIAIQQAYETLSDPQRRARYDAGFDDDNRSQPAISAMEEMLRAMSGAGTASANGFTYIFVNSGNVRRQPPAEARVYVTLEQIYHATPVHADVDIRVRVDAPPEKNNAKPAFRTERRRFSLQFRSVAEIQRPVILRQRGHQNEDARVPDGDVMVRPLLVRHALYEPVADGNDLLYRHTVTLGDVLHGCECTLQRLDHAASEPLSIRVSPEQLRIEPGVVIQCDQEGMPIGNGRRGRLYILFDVDFTTTATSKCEPFTAASTQTTWQRAPASVEYTLAQSLFSTKAQHMLQRRQHV